MNNMDEKVKDESQLDVKERDRILESLQEDWNIKEDVSFNEYNIKEKLETHPFKLIQYSDQLEKERFVLDRIKDIYDKVVGKRYDFYRFQMDERLTQREIEQYYLPKDEKVIKIKETLKAQEIRVKFFEICVKALEKMSWNMKNWIDRNRTH